jgi:hypothetical protein
VRVRRGHADSARRPAGRVARKPLNLARLSAVFVGQMFALAARMKRTLLAASVAGSLLLRCGVPQDVTTPNASPSRDLIREELRISPIDPIDPIGPIGPIDPIDPGDTPPVNPTPPGPRVFDFETSPLTEFQVDLTAGVTVTYETRNCTPGTDPVLHLFKPGASSDQRTQLAADDNGAGALNARIRISPTTGGIGFVLARATNDARGQCDLWRNGYPWKSGVSVGGKTVVISGARSTDAVETVAMPNGGTNHVLYKLSGLGITQRIRGGTGTGGAARTTLGASSASFLIGGSGPTRVVVNDVATDTDGDGLGNALEAALTTCAAANGYAGNFDCALAKTPQDTDGDGLSDAWEVLGKRDQTPHQLLPLWGADPRHKDLFVEVDFGDDGQAPARLPISSVRTVAAYFHDTIEPSTPLIKAIRAALVNNPDQKPGIAVHIDNGLLPMSPAESTLHGNWGGFNVVPSPQNYPSDWVNHMSPARRGVFHWVLGTRSGAGQASGFAVVVNINNGAALAHELGHTMGIGHDGAPSTGSANCKPQYASLMNYAYSYAGVGFSDGIGPATMNNTALTEYGVLANSSNKARFADLYERVFRYSVDRNTWSVDFNRDGDIAPAGTTVKAYANSGPGLDCEGTRHRRYALMDSATTAHTPAIARLTNRMMVFSATDVGLQLQHGLDTYGGCDTAGGQDGTSPCGTFGTPYTVVGGAIQAVDATTVGSSVLFVYVDAQRALRSGVLSVTSGAPSVSLHSAVLATGVSGEPALAVESTTTALVVFKAVDGTLYESRFNAGSGWETPAPSRGPSGQPFKVSDAPGIVKGRLPGETAVAMILHSTHDTLGYATTSLMTKAADGTWVASAFSGNTSATRPALAFVQNQANPQIGKLYAITTQPGGQSLRVRSSAVTVSSTGVKTPVFGLDSAFDNTWYESHGIDALFEAGFDTNLRVAIVPSFGQWNQHPVFQPLADGIVSFPYGTFDDWTQLGKKACASIANPGGLVSNPIPCF